MGYIHCIFEVYIVKNAEKYLSQHPALNLTVEIPFLCLVQDLPTVLVWHIYSACFCTLIKLQIHMTPEHIKACSVHLLLFRPQTVLKEVRGRRKKKSPLRYADMFIPWLYSLQSQETSLAYHISPCMNLHLDTERHFKGASNISVSKNLPTSIGKIFWKN